MGVFDFLKRLRTQDKKYVVISTPLDPKEFERVVKLWKTKHSEVIWTTDEGVKKVLDEIVDREYHD